MIIDAANEVIPSVFAYLGLDPKSTDKEDLDAAEKVLTSIAPYVRAYNSSSILSAMANGEICLSLDWSPDVYQAQARAVEAKNGHNIRYVIPKEGAFMWFDQLAIPKDAANVDNAHKFINYVMQPEVIAQVSNYTYVANGIDASIPFLDDGVRNDPGIYPPQETVARLFAMDSYPQKFQRLITRSWTRVKSGL
jgi:putrescine transport system substrate-binding protein